MNHVKRYILMALLVVTACVLKFNNFGSDYEAVDTFRGATLEKTDWNPLIADSVNEKTISVAIDSKEYTSNNMDIYMDDNLNIMMPIEVLSEGLNCSSHLYNKEELLVEKRTNQVVLGLNDPEISVNYETKDVSSPMIERDGKFYISIGELAENIGYSFKWDIEKNQAVAVDSSETASIFPPSYDLRDKARIGKIKNQGSTGTCWAFAALSALESAILPEQELEFAPDHMSKANSFGGNPEEGGEYTMGMAYLLSWQGPVFEKDDPFGDDIVTEGLQAEKHVQEVQMMEGKDYEKIKEAVFRYGGVQTSFYSALRNSNSSSPFYNMEKKAYCYIGTEKPNHEVVIIGWDDNYPKENFPISVEGDGAFICQNSWGEEFGEDGVFYVSYYDTNIGSHNVVYTKVEDKDNYDHIYQSDLCGWVGQIGFQRPSVYGANVYTAGSDEELSAVGFYATGKDTEYKVYLVKDFKDKDSFKNMEQIAEGKLKNAGYYTVPIASEPELPAGEKYAVVLYLNTPEAVHPMAIEYAADEATADVDLSDGEGYISATGNYWDDAEDTSGCNLCIKAYTRDK